MTTQEAYEAIRAWFSRPDAEFGMEEDDLDGLSCRYRVGGEVDSPLRCALGCLIPDELYFPEMDGYGDADDVLDAATVFTAYHEVCDLFPETATKRFLVAAQVAHDNCATRGGTMREFLARLDSAACKYNLEVK